MKTQTPRHYIIKEYFSLISYFNAENNKELSSCKTLFNWHLKGSKLKLRRPINCCREMESIDFFPRYRFVLIYIHLQVAQKNFLSFFLKIRKVPNQNSSDAFKSLILAYLNSSVYSANLWLSINCISLEKFPHSIKTSF